MKWTEENSGMSKKKKKDKKLNKRIGKALEKFRNKLHINNKFLNRRS